MVQDGVHASEFWAEPASMHPVYDDPVAMHCLASVAQSISFAGGILEVEPYTVVAPLYASWKKLDRATESPTKEARSPGMEVA